MAIGKQHTVKISKKIPNAGNVVKITKNNHLIPKAS